MKLFFFSFCLIFLYRGRVAVFSILCEKYQTSINRDPSYREVGLLSKTESLFIL